MKLRQAALKSARDMWADYILVSVREAKGRAGGKPRLRRRGHSCVREELGFSLLDHLGFVPVMAALGA
jgi:hypothetical protein